MSYSEVTETNEDIRNLFCNVFNKSIDYKDAFDILMESRYLIRQLSFKDIRHLSGVHSHPDSDNPVNYINKKLVIFLNKIWANTNDNGLDNLAMLLKKDIDEYLSEDKMEVD